MKLEKIIADILSKNEDKVTEYFDGKDKLFGYFLGQVMKETGGKANPGEVNKLLIEALRHDNLLNGCTTEDVISFVNTEKSEEEPTTYTLSYKDDTLKVEGDDGKNWFVNLPNVKRNKKVDVPTEQWQKNVERRLDISENRYGLTNAKINDLYKRIEALDNWVNSVEYRYGAHLKDLKDKL